MKIRAVCALALTLAGAAAGCSGSPSPITTQVREAVTTTTTPTTVPVPASTTTATTLDAGTRATVAVVGEASEECDNFTIALDRFVFVRLQPIVEEATDLLHSEPEGVDSTEVAAGLMEASRQLLGMVDELDLMGVPPREVVDLLLSIREGTLRYAAGLEKGARGWESRDAGSIAEAKAELLGASAVLTEFFGWQMCP